MEEAVPDEKTIWDYSNKLSQNGAGKKLFDIFDRQIRAKGLITQTGSIVDAKRYRRYMDTVKSDVDSGFST